MAVFLSPVGGVAAQFFTNTGAVLTGGKLYTYLAGTTTPAATYTSATGVTFNTNPIVLDAAGRVPSSGEIWLGEGVQYKFVLKDSNDVLIASYDNITGINSNFVNYNALEEIQTATAGQTVFNLTNSYQPGTNTLSVFVDGVNQYDGSSYSYTETNSTTVTFTAGLHVGALVKFTTAVTLSAGVTTSNLVSYTPAGTGAVATTVQAKLRQTVSVMDFGAIGNNVADDTAAIQAAINSFGDVGGAIYFPPGNYKVTAALTSPQVFPDEGETLLFGAGGATTITSTHNGPVINFPQGSTTKIQDMKFVGPGVSLTSSTAYLGTLSKGTLINCNISNFYIGVNIDNTIGGVIDRCYIHHCYHGVHAVTTPAGDFINLLDISNTWLDSNVIGLTAYFVFISIFNNLTLNNNTLYGANLERVFNVTFNGLWCESATDLLVLKNCVPTFLSSRVFATYSYDNIEALGLTKTKFTVANGITYTTDANYESWNPDTNLFATTTTVRSFPQFPAAGQWRPAVQFQNPSYTNNGLIMNMNPTDGTSYLTTAVNTGTNGLVSLTTTSASDIIGLELFNNTYPNSGKPTIAFTNWSSGGLYSPRFKASGNAIYFSGLVGGGAITGGEFSALSDGGPTLGSASHRWNTVYASTGSINTSDANQKQQIALLTEAEQTAAKAIKGLIRTFKFNDAVEKKGDKARIHVGVIAQQVQAAFSDCGLDASNYAIFCEDVWYEYDGKTVSVNDNKQYVETLYYVNDELVNPNDDGQFPENAVPKTSTHDTVKKTRLGIRYDELLAVIISAL